MRKKNKKFYLVLILIVLFGVSVGYAAISRTLNITGNSEVKKNTWDLHFENLKVTDGSVEAETPTINNDKLSVDFNFMLNLPGDFYEFTVDVKNSGSIDAMIESIEKTPELTEEQKKYMTYIVEYQNGNQIASKQLVSRYNGFVKIKVRVEFRSDVLESDMPTTNQTIDLGFILNYVQADNTGVYVSNNGFKPVTVVKGDGTNKSDEVCIDRECFYVMYSDAETVTMLAKYNLYVGGEYDTSNSQWIPYGEEATGKQDLNMLGIDYSGGVYKGTTKFSDINYWDSDGLKTEYGYSYPAYVYDSNSTLYSYVENYKTYLETLGVTLIEARLITYQEVFNIMRSENGFYDAPDWLYSTSYWTGTAGSSSDLWAVHIDTDFNDVIYSFGDYFGVRPVIVISKNAIDGTDSGYTKNLIRFIIDGIVYYAEERITWEEWVNSDLGYSINEFSEVKYGFNCVLDEQDGFNVTSDELIINDYNYALGECSAG